MINIVPLWKQQYTPASTYATHLSLSLTKQVIEFSIQSRGNNIFHKNLSNKHQSQDGGLPSTKTRSFLSSSEIKYMDEYKNI
jgi:hypothetical protein